MLSGNNSFYYSMDYVDIQNAIAYAHLFNFETESEQKDRVVCSEELEYVFQLIKSAFLYIQVLDDFCPGQRIEDKVFYLRQFYILSLPFKNETRWAEVEQWNELVASVTDDFFKRKAVALRGVCSYEDLEALVLDQIEGFDYDDRRRLDPVKLVNLITFIYDYCVLTMREAHLHPGLDTCIPGSIKIRKKEFRPPLRVCASIKLYEPYVYVPDITWPFENYTLPKVQLAQEIKNPHASDSVMSAMFVDLMHKFFLSFGLQKRGKSEWSRAEKELIYELLRKFGFCKSNKSAAESKYVTTVLKDYGNYFSSCNLRSWIRIDQAYSYLLGCPLEEFVRKGQQIEEPFLPLNYYSVIEDKENMLEEVGSKSEDDKNKTKLSVDDLPADLKKAMKEVAREQIVVTHTKYGLIGYATEQKRDHSQEEMPEWDPRLDYVMALIFSSFEYVSFMPSLQKYLIARLDLQDPEVISRLVSSLEIDLLGRLEMIPRELFSQEDVRNAVLDTYKYMTKEDRKLFDVDKFIVLVLFIFDYVYLTFKEAKITPHLKKFINSKVFIGNIMYPSTVLIDDMLTSYLEVPFDYESEENDSQWFQVLRGPDLYVPYPKDNYPIELESCSVKNMTAMFYDLFVRFFKILGLSKRSDVKYLSEVENNLVAALAYTCGICSTANAGSVRRMYMDNRDYFQKNSLEVIVRENEYSYLMLNTMSEELFGQ